MRRPIYYYTHVESAFAVAREVLAGSPASWLPRPAAAEDGDAWRVELATDGLLAGAGIPVAIHVGPLFQIGDGRTVLRRLRWRAAAATSLFPTFDGDLELTALTRELSQLTLVGGYRPPMSVLGEAGDRIAGHHVAEAVLRRFAETVARNLVGEVRSSTLVT